MQNDLHIRIPALEFAWASFDILHTRKKRNLLWLEKGGRRRRGRENGQKIGVLHLKPVMRKIIHVTKSYFCSLPCAYLLSLAQVCQIDWFALNTWPIEQVWRSYLRNPLNKYGIYHIVYWFKNECSKLVRVCLTGFRNGVAQQQCELGIAKCEVQIIFE